MASFHDGPYADAKFAPRWSLRCLSRHNIAQRRLCDTPRYRWSYCRALKAEARATRRRRRDTIRYAQRVVGDDPKPSGPGLEFSIADYNAARADCLQGLIGQQSILTWSIAAIGVLFAAGLSISPHIREADTVRHWVFFLGIPLLTLGASIAWLGEIFRMERDAHYMRLL